MVREPEPSDARYYVTAPLMWPLVLALRALGMDADAVMQRAGLRIEALQDPDTRVPARQALIAMQAAIEQSGDPAFGLKLSQMYEPGMFAVLDYLAHSSSTLREAIERLCRYERIHQNGVRTSLNIEGERAVLQQDVLVPFAMPRHVIENGLGNTLVIGRKLTGQALVPSAVTFTHEEPADTTEHTRLFGVRPQFGARRNALVFDAAWLALPLTKANPALANVLEHHARELLARMSQGQRLTDKVRETLATLLPDGHLTIEHVARALKMTRRTLQRRLEAEGTHFKDLVEQLRIELSLRYLSEPSLGIEDVALMLGFSDARAFRRAFKRWRNVSPRQHRKSAG